MKRILIIDDDQAILEAMQMMLEMKGYHVQTATYCENIRIISSLQPDLLFLDILMPGKDGRDVCRAIKSDVAFSGLPIVMISASRQVKESALESGADDFLAKPFQMDELLSIVSKYLQPDDSYRA
jgi:DNA-binding response OmpR family regulator